MNCYYYSHGLLFISPPTQRWFLLFLLTSTVNFQMSTSSTPSLDNVAVGKPAVIDSLYEAEETVAYAKHAVDGDSTSTGLWDYSCAHSDDTQNFPKWWIVDLLRPYEIHKVLLTNRNSFAGRLQNFSIEMFETDPVAQRGFPARNGELCYQHRPGTPYPLESETVTYTCTQPLIGRYVRIRKYNYFSLVLCEVQVMADVNHRYFATRIPNLKANNPPIGVFPNVDSYLGCAIRCAQNLLCSGFIWNHVVLECNLLSVSPYGTVTNYLFAPDNDWSLTMSFNANPP